MVTLIGFCKSRQITIVSCVENEELPQMDVGTTMPSVVSLPSATPSTEASTLSPMDNPVVSIPRTPSHSATAGSCTVIEETNASPRLTELAPKTNEKEKLLFLAYALISVNEGGLETLPSSLFTNISEQLSISELQTSYIMLSRSVSYVASTFLTAFVMDTFRATHRYLAVVLSFGAICCCVIPFIKEYSAHFVMWSVLGMCSGTIDVSLPVYVYRRWPTKGSNYYLVLLVIFRIAKLLTPLLIQVWVQISGGYGFALFLIAAVAVCGSSIAMCLDTPQHDKFRFGFCIKCGVIIRINRDCYTMNWSSNWSLLNVVGRSMLPWKRPIHQRVPRKSRKSCPSTPH